MVGGDGIGRELRFSVKTPSSLLAQAGIEDRSNVIKSWSKHPSWSQRLRRLVSLSVYLLNTNQSRERYHIHKEHDHFVHKPATLPPLPRVSRSPKQIRRVLSLYPTPPSLPTKPFSFAEALRRVVDLKGPSIVGSVSGAQRNPYNEADWANTHASLYLTCTNAAQEQRLGYIPTRSQGMECLEQFAED